MTFMDYVWHVALYLRCLMNNYFSRRHEPGFWVKSVYVMYRDHQGPLRRATDEFTTERRQLNVTDAWCDIARDILTSNEGDVDVDVPVKMEVRYVHRNMFGHETKYRLVAYEGDTETSEITLPPPRRPTEEPRKIDPPVIQCMLLPADDGTEDEPRNPLDITGRVLKYMGPYKDFNTSQMRVFEMFPFDDPDQFRESFHSLLAVDFGSQTLIRVNDVVS
jgi:hypothetical protein